MEKSELDKLVRQYIEEKSKRPSRINRKLTYTLYNEMLKPKRKRSHKDCTCMDAATDTQVSMHIEKHYQLDPLPIKSNVKIELEGMTKPSEVVTKPKPKVKRKRRTTKKKNEGTEPNGVSTDS